MTTDNKIEKEIIKNFGYAYRAFGLNKLMGSVVALLLCSKEPLSLDDIAKTLARSKGPISQITRRLRDKNLIRRVWHPTSRKDFYEIQPEVFENAFRNNFELIKSNTRLAKQLLNVVDNVTETHDFLKDRLSEMQLFYEIMEKHYQNFLDEWMIERTKLLNNKE
ncbi:MAG: MarR family transcriptional regulator [bacterium]